MKETYWIFRCRTKRGTDVRICAKMKKGATNSEALEVAMYWANKITEGSSCREYLVPGLTQLAARSGDANGPKSAKLTRKSRTRKLTSRL